MKLSAKNLDSFLNSPSPDIVAVLVHGQDVGLIHETVLRIAATTVENLSDPFRVSELKSDEILRNPSTLIDEFTAQSLVGGKRIVRVELGNENISETLKSLFAVKEPSTLLILEAGNLKPSSPVRKLMEKENKAIAVACYKDGETELSKLITEVTKPYGLTISQDARDYLINNLGSDRMVTRRELEKLVLYVGDKTSVSFEDAVNIVGDRSVLSVEEIIFAATSGNRKKLSAGLSHAAINGISSMALLRAAQRHIQRLLLINGLCAKGKKSTDAMKMLRPRVLFLFEEEFRSQTAAWTPSNLTKALNLLTIAEINCKSTGMPEMAVRDRALLQLTQLAKAK